MKHQKLSADRNVRDGSIPNPVPSIATAELFKSAFDAERELERFDLIAHTADSVALEASLFDNPRIGRRYQTLSQWMCSMTNKLIPSMPQKAKIPDFRPVDVEELMIAHDDLMPTEPLLTAETSLEDEQDRAAVTFATLSILSYLRERAVTDNATLSEFTCVAVASETAQTYANDSNLVAA